MTIKSFIKKLIPPGLLGFYYVLWPFVGAVVFGFAGEDKNLKIIGVTGTSGKSTTTDLISRILKENGGRVASISTIRFKIADKEWENKYKMSMPGRFVIQKFLKQAKNAGCKYVVLEVTSEGIKQFRHKFINFDTAVFTNLGQEHLESHGGFENYRNEKLKLFRATKNNHVINISDDNADYFWNISAKEKIGFKIKNQKSKIKNTDQNSKIVEAENIETKDDISFKVQDTEFKIHLVGEFNVNNALAAITVCNKVYGIDLETCKKALEKAKGIQGRMEIVAKTPFEVIVDYAHTPEQLESVYRTLNSRPLICVLGSCGGGRDKWKRPVLGKIAAQYCKEIIITNEDPYDEDPEKIINQVAETAGPKAKKILDRKEAIKTAIKLTKPGEVVIITGKGSEPWMCVKNGKKIPWDDRQIAKDALANQ